MRLAIFAAGLLIVSLVCSSVAADDVIFFRDGKQVVGRVTEYADRHLRIELPDGKIIIRKISGVERIQFGDQLSGEIQRVKNLLEQAIAEVKPSLSSPARPRAAVAMYLDTVDREATIPNGEVEYRCYSGGGYSGIKRAPLRMAFIQHETVRRDGAYRIELDPGPPYKILNHHVTLKAGEVVNLGRILLEKQEYEGTASIHGTVRNAFGEPMSGAKVTAGQKHSMSDVDGRYQLDGFELEEVSILAKAEGYRGGSARIAIRDMQNRNIEQDLTLFRPRRVKLRYVISAKGDHSFVGPKVQQGAIDLVVDSSRTDLSTYHYQSSSFSEFAADTRLNLRFEQGELKLDNFHAPIFFVQSADGTEFDTIESIGKVGYNNQHCPPLKVGKFVIVRGFRDTQNRGVSQYCVKLLVEEISIVQPAAENE